MAIGPETPVGRVAAIVSSSLRAAGVDAVLTGGACATIYSGGAYVSHDLDFIIRAGGNRQVVDGALAGSGFKRSGDRYVHPRTALFVEFPRGPLAIGDDLKIRPVRLRVGRGWTSALSATDSCRDRLAAFYHWSDRQSLTAAVAIARRHRINMRAIRLWSRREGADAEFEEFRSALVRARAGGRRKSR
jgi:hypothetical protein